MVDKNMALPLMLKTECKIPDSKIEKDQDDDEDGDEERI
jgi:hypothetical protein